MVPPSSHGVSRVPRYFGYSSLTLSFAYVTLTLFGTFSHTFQLEIINTKYVDKVKFKHLGVGGVATFVYDPVNGRYLPCEESHDPAVPPEQRARNTVYDSSCWLPEKELF